MIVKQLLFVLFLATVAIAAPLTQNQVDAFIRTGNLVPPSAVLKNFELDRGNYIAVYEDKFTKFKFMIGQGPDGKLFVIFRHQVTQINISNDFRQPIQQPQFIPIHPTFQFEQMPMISVPPMPTLMFDQQRFSGMEGKNRRHGRRANREMGRGRERPFGGRGCKINEQEVKILLKENLAIFKNAEIKQIITGGFQRGTGIILNILIVNDGKQYNIKAGYMPRWGKLNILKVQQSTMSVETPQIIGQPVIEQKPAEQDQFAQMDNLIQSFVQKLLIRKSFNLGQQHSHSHMQKPPGSEGEPQFIQAPFLLGSEGQPQLVQQPPFLLGSEGEPQFVQQPPFLLGSEGQPESIPAPILLGTEGEPQNPTPLENDNQQEDSQQISELVTQVISKLKLKKQ